MFSRSNLACELCGKSGFLARQLFHKTKNSSSEIILPSYASNSISLGSEKTFFTEVFASFQGSFRKGCRRKNASLLKVGFWREQRRPLTQACSFGCRRRPKNVRCLSSLVLVHRCKTRLGACLIFKTTLTEGGGGVKVTTVLCDFSRNLPGKNLV